MERDEAPGNEVHGQHGATGQAGQEKQASRKQGSAAGNAEDRF